MKKLISILLAIVMCFSITTVAFAAEEETPAVSEENIIAVLLEAAKIASDLNAEAREKLSEEIEKLLIEQIAGDNIFLQQAAQWILDKALELSGSDNILSLDEEQAEKIAEILTKMYDGNIADYIDNPFIKFIVNFIPKDVFKKAVVWLLSDGFGDALQDFIDKYGDGEAEETPEVESKPESGNDTTTSNPLEDMDWGVALSAAVQALKDVVQLVVDQITSIFGSTQTASAA